MLKVKKLDPRAKLPEVAHVGDLGYDLFALEDTVLKFGVVTKVRTGVSVQAFEENRKLVDRDNSAGGPSEYMRIRYKPLGLLIRDRSSMAAKGIVVSGGVLDSGYIGEISVLMTNWNNEHTTMYLVTRQNMSKIVNVTPGSIIPVENPETSQFLKEYTISAGDKIAQMIPLPVLTGEVVEVEELGESSRGSDGFGSSGQ